MAGVSHPLLVGAVVGISPSASHSAFPEVELATAGVRGADAGGADAFGAAGDGTTGFGFATGALEGDGLAFEAPPGIFTTD